MKTEKSAPEKKEKHEVPRNVNLLNKGGAALLTLIFAAYFSHVIPVLCKRYYEEAVPWLEEGINEKNCYLKKANDFYRDHKRNPTQAEMDSLVVLDPCK